MQCVSQQPTKALLTTLYLLDKLNVYEMYICSIQNCIYNSKPRVINLFKCFLATRNTIKSTLMQLLR